MPRGINSLKKYSAGLLAGLLAFGPSLGLAQEMKQKSKGKPTNVKAKSLTDEQKVLHLLDRTSFGPRPGEVERVLKLGWQKYLDEQLHPERIDDQALEQKLKNIESQGLGNSELARTYFPPQQVLASALKARGLDIADTKSGKAKADQMAADNTKDEETRRREARRVLAEAGYKPGQQLIAETQAAKIQRAVYSERQLQEVMTDFWFNHFNVYMQKGADRVLTTAYERDTIRPRVFGKFEDLLKATAESPAMLWYLDNWQSATPNMKMPAFNNRNELRQLRNKGDLTKIDRQRLRQMREMIAQRNAQNPQANPQRLPSRMPRGINENYAREIMELHTLGVDGGYTQKDVQEVARCLTGWTLRNPRAGAEFVFSKFMHDDDEKIVLGKKIPAGGGVQDGYAVIHLLATHPSTAKFISTKLARKFVSDNPSQTLVNKMAQTFQKTEGDIREVLKTMLNASEFWSPEVYRAKIKTPFEMTVSAVRALGADTNGNPQFHRWLAQMGEGLFLMQPPTGYPDTAEHWVNTGALLERMNFALALSSNRIAGTRVDLSRFAPSTRPNSQAQLIDHYAKVLLRGEITPQTRATIHKSLSESQLAMNDHPVAAVSTKDAAKIVGLLVGSPEFQRQ
jgi:uncharacterized protein (DUF1800 family)